MHWATRLLARQCGRPALLSGPTPSWCPWESCLWLRRQACVWVMLSSCHTIRGGQMVYGKPPFHDLKNTVHKMQATARARARVHAGAWL